VVSSFSYSGRSVARQKLLATSLRFDNRAPLGAGHSCAPDLLLAKSSSGGLNSKRAGLALAALSRYYRTDETPICPRSTGHGPSLREGVSWSKRKMAVWRRPGLLRQRNPGVPSNVMVCLRVLARTGRLDWKRPCASFSPSSGSTAMSILRIARWRSARGMIEWMCTQVRWDPEVAIILARRRATTGLQLAAAMMTRIRIIHCFTQGRFAPTPALWGASSSYRPVRVMAVRRCSKCCLLFRAFRGRALFVRGMMHSYFQWARRVRGSRRAGSSGISWRIHSLVTKTLHRHRAGFEPQRASSFMKRVEASQILGEAVRA
jgi:hypothetical protein